MSQARNCGRIFHRAWTQSAVGMRLSDWREGDGPARTAGAAGAEFVKLTRLVPKLRLGTYVAKLCFAGQTEYDETRNGVSRIAFPNGVWERGRTCKVYTRNCRQQVIPAVPGRRARAS